MDYHDADSSLKFQHLIIIALECHQKNSQHSTREDYLNLETHIFVNYEKGWPARDGLTSSLNIEFRVRMLSARRSLRAERAASCTVWRAARAEDIANKTIKNAFISDSVKALDGSRERNLYVKRGKIC